MEQWLNDRRYLVGERITEADWRAFPTLLRFDPVYHGHFKCNLRRVQDNPIYETTCASCTSGRGSERRSICKKPKPLL